MADSYRTRADVIARLSDQQRRVTQDGDTEPAFRNEYWDNKEAGIYVDVVSSVEDDLVDGIVPECNSFARTSIGTSFTTIATKTMRCFGVSLRLSMRLDAETLG